MLSSKTGPFKKSGKLQREKINQKNESNDCEDFIEEQQTEDFTKQPTRNFPEEHKGDLVKFSKEELTKCTKEGYKENLTHFTNELAGQGDLPVEQIQDVTNKLLGDKLEFFTPDVNELDITDSRIQVENQMKKNNIQYLVLSFISMILILNMTL